MTDPIEDIAELVSSKRAFSRDTSMLPASRGRVSYPKPTTFGAWGFPVKRSGDYPLHPPTGSPPPSLPSRPPIKPLPDTWLRTEYAIPAAHPRLNKAAYGNLKRSSSPFRKGELPENENKEERYARAIEEAREAGWQRYHAREEDWDKVDMKDWPLPLWMAGERWVRKGAKGDGVTIVVTHANGFTKESWHPTFRRLLAKPPPISTSTFGSQDTEAKNAHVEKELEIEIDEIWFLDDIHHGASIDLNEGRIGPIHNWLDGARDIINLIEHVLPPLVTDPVEADGEVLKWRKSVSKRKVIGVGHSFGGNALVQAAHKRPDLFHGLFLAEPITAPFPYEASILHHPTMKYRPLPLGAIRRRTSWPSLKSHADSVRNTPFFGPWHPEVWDLWLSHGIVPVPGTDEGVQLATPSWAECSIFSELIGPREAFDKLPEVRVPLGFLMAGDARTTWGEQATGETVWRAPMSSNERIMDAGHLIVQEKPDEVADALWRFLGSLSPCIVAEKKTVKAKL